MATSRLAAVTSRTLAGLICSTVLCVPVWAHHSAAMYDPVKVLTFSGLVKKWEFTNPHVFLYLTVPDGQGVAPGNYAIEFGSPNHLYRSGIKSDALSPNDKVTVSISPLRDGSKGGRINTLTLPNGKTVNHTSAGGAGPAGARPEGIPIPTP